MELSHLTAPPMGGVPPNPTAPQTLCFSYGISIDLIYILFAKLAPQPTLVNTGHQSVGVRFVAY